MHKMMVRTDQLLCIAEATNLKVYTLEAKGHGQMKALVLSLKQYHAFYYQLYEKDMTKAMAGLQELHSGDDHLLQCEAKIILPLVFQSDGNTKTIATHLREVHYRLAI